MTTTFPQLTALGDAVANNFPEIAGVSLYWGVRRKRHSDE
jgi:hypothetical protein